MDSSSSTPPTTASAAAPAKAPRSQFLQKLHSILENPLDPNGLRWVTDDSFEISSKDAVAINALSPAFEFHSLSSFIRQLSYYSFRRLSDRRRSTERRNSNPGYVLFQHPSGFFVRGDPSQLNKIVRKARTRSEKGRRASECSTASDETYPAAMHPYPMPTWPPGPDYRSSFSSDRPTLQLPSFGSAFVPAPVPQRIETTQWRAYAPTTGAWLDPNRDDLDRFAPPRRSSLGEFKLSSPTTTGGLPGQPAPYSVTLSSLQEEQRPRLRKALSSNCVPSEEEHPHDLYAEPPSHHVVHGFRGSPYPTPTFSPTSNTYFDTGPHAIPSHSSYPVHGPSGSYTGVPHMTYETSPFAASYHPIAPPLSSTAKHRAAHSYHTPSPDQSPLQEVVGLPALVETVPPVGHPAHPASGTASTTTADGGEFAPRAAQQDGRQSPRSGIPYAQLPPMQARYLGVSPNPMTNSSSVPGLSHAPWQPTTSQGYPTGHAYSYAAPPSSATATSAGNALPPANSQWSPPPIRTAY